MGKALPTMRRETPRMANSFLANPSATVETLRRWSLHTKKSLGQHFLVDDATVGKILDLSDIESGQTVLEVGPGIGTLTAGLVSRGAHVVAVERDGDLLPALRDNVAIAADGDADALTLLEMDALDLDMPTLARACGGEVGEDGGNCDKGGDGDGDEAVQRALPSKLVSNLPYAVAATIVLEYMQKIDCLDMACVMVQAEAAERMCASPATKNYGAYTVKLGLFANPGRSFAVKPGSFLPPPRVDSKVIRLDRRRDVGDAQLLGTACLLADAAFSQRRKTIRNSMQSYLASHGGAADVLDPMLERCGIDPRSRGEVHPIGAYVQMAREFLSLAV